jgi:hypothetical protein
LCLCPHVVTVAGPFCWRSGVAFVHIVACVPAISDARAVAVVSANAGVTAVAGVPGDPGTPTSAEHEFLIFRISGIDYKEWISPTYEA